MKGGASITMQQRLHDHAGLYRGLVCVQAIARVAALKRGLGSVYEAMPRDLQQTMLSSPSRAALLQSLSVQSRVPGLPSRRSAAAGLQQ